jgi:hypothetical protein
MSVLIWRPFPTSTRGALHPAWLCDALGGPAEAGVDAPGVGMNYRQAGIGASQAPPQIPSLLPIMTTAQPLENRFYTLRHVILPSSENQTQARLSLR